MIDKTPQPKPKLHLKADANKAHFPATWVNRFSEDLECLDLEDEQPLATLSQVQTDKMTLFFTELLDHDRDDVICDQDFDTFCEVGTAQVSSGFVFIG